MEEIMKCYGLFYAVLTHANQRLVGAETYIVIARHKRYGNIEATNRLALEQGAVGGLIQIGIVAIVVDIQLGPRVVDQGQVRCLWHIITLIEHHPHTIEHLANRNRNTQELTDFVVAIGDHELHVVVATRAADHGFQVAGIANRVDNGATAGA